MADPAWDERPARRGRRLLWVGVAGVLVAVTATVTTVVLREQPTEAQPTPELYTATVVRTDLAQRQRFDGTLGFAGSYPVPARPRPDAILTALPAEGQVIRRGQRLYGVDGRPVPLLYGSTPLWRRLAVDVDDGPDVAQLEDNLHAMGFGAGVTPDEHFSQGTADALAEWQRSIGVPDTGALEPADAVVEPGEVRVTAVTATPGAAPAGTLLTLSSTNRIVTAEVPVAQQSLAKVGAAVQIGLPSGPTTPGRIQSVSTVASARPDQSGGESADSATIPVHITLAKPADAGTLDGAPVTVDIVSDTHAGVLAVPVSALLATPDGGYAVDIVDDPARPAGIRRAPVELGFFANGLVEVTAPGLAEGTKVQVPSPL